MPGYVLGNFSIYSVINAFTPGSGNILALNIVTNYGYKRGRPLTWVGMGGTDTCFILKNRNKI